ncbi:MULTISPECIES: dihydroorotate dehydrogenase [Prauserella salsuginis group]|uniref:dihydroorotate dehydrogenase n=1 Tax=Prauserella salsuginis group TaxID=2893672 RepID=UPI0021643439|nr:MULTISPECIES: dihydroorotate dehydrogenase [Prauserella salsuginis group]MCR3722098.1 dihydroorotate dehydrogenase (NAD+) catalytic subunit [Prauserella flava]MCR3736095.1 dihydroorotate dehydrogenase (NAD+) catalytic subunit [Prauserella salsuginis]
MELGDLELANPVMPASGCFGPELAELTPVDTLGAVVTKTVFAQSRPGNRTHRITEVPGGMLNSVGIPSRGTTVFRDSGLGGYAGLGAPVVISIGGLSAQEYWQVVDELGACEHAAVEVNVSCPNLEHGGATLDTDLDAMTHVVSGVVARSTKPVLVKLSPQLHGMAAAARAAQDAGATAVTVCNSFPAMAVNANSRASELGNGTGGLSGPSVKPLALRLVWTAAQAVDIPVVGCGGIGSADDVAEFLIAGATAVQVGTATFAQPDVMPRIIGELPALTERLGAERIADLIGTLTIRSEDWQ